MDNLHLLPCLDSHQLAASRWQELDLPLDIGAALGRSALDASRNGFYVTRDGREVVWRDVVLTSSAGKRSIAPDAVLPVVQLRAFPQTRVQVTNETTLGASRRLVDSGLKPLALNFANGVHAGGAFLVGTRTQEDVLCQCSALYLTLIDDVMYDEHRKRPEPDSTDWAIYSPGVPVFRTDDGTELSEPWLLSFLTCAAPYAPDIGQPRSGDLLEKRIHRVLAIARAFGYTTLVLGAWGCGAFRNDPHRTARDFRSALECEFRGAFSDVVFAIVDWSRERRFLAPFRDVFAVKQSPGGLPG